MHSRSKLIDRARTANRESKSLDFKREFDDSPAAWCELIKDIIAFANSGGGVMVFGVDDDGSNVGANFGALVVHDSADITNRVAKYTGFQFSDFEVTEVERSGISRLALIVGEADVPIIFTKPGTYDIGEGRQKTAFSQGTLYFRHGSKSEPGNRDDLLAWREREIARARKSWLGGIRKVVHVPPGETISVLSSAAIPRKDGNVVHARIATDATTVPVVPTNAQEIWPFRQIDLVQDINRRLAGRTTINSYDVQSINKMIDALKSHPEFAYKPHKLAAPQYSTRYAEWIVTQFTQDQNFFANARAKVRPRHG